MSFNPHQWYLNGKANGGDPNAYNVLITGASYNNTGELRFRLKSYPSGEELPADTIKNFRMVGTNCYFLIETPYQVRGNPPGTSFFDYGNYCKTIEASAFQNGATREIRFQGVTSINAQYIVASSECRIVDLRYATLL